MPKIVQIGMGGSDVASPPTELTTNLDPALLFEDGTTGADFIEVDTTTGSQKLILAGGGAKVGIGTTDPGELLELSDGTRKMQFDIGTSGTATEIAAVENDLKLATRTGFKNILFAGTGGEYLRMNHQGKLSTNETTALCAEHGLHLKETDTGVTSVSDKADMLVIETSHPGISLIGTNTDRNTIAFGDPQSNIAGELRYTHGGGSNADMFFLIMHNSVAINVDHDHKLGVNHECADASGQLQVNCPDGANVPCVVVDQNDSTNNPVALEIQNAGSGDGIKYAGPSSKFFHVKSDGDCENTNNSYGAISDRRLKENITDATPKLDDLNKLHVCNFNFKGDDLKQIGLIADEVAEVFPALVKSSDTRTYASTEIIGDSGETQIEKSLIGGFEDQKSVKYSVLVPMLVKCIQELNAKIDKIEEALENGN